MTRTRGLAYILANIDPALWASVKRRAAADGMTIRQFIFRALKRTLDAHNITVKCHCKSCKEKEQAS